MDLNRSSISDISEIIDNLDVSLNDINISTDTENESDDKTTSIIYKVMQFYIRHNLTLICLEDTARLLNTCTNLYFPTSKIQIMKLFEERMTIKFGKKYFVNCTNCKTYIECPNAHSSKCSECNADLIRTETIFFIYLPIETQIIYSLTKNWSAIQRYNIETESNYIVDIHNASHFKSIYNKITPGRNLLSLMVNTDGANKFKSNTSSVWPIQLIQNYLPPNLRYLPKNIILAAIYYGLTKPNCLEFFFPLVSELKRLHQNGILMKIGNEDFVFEPVVTHCSVDLPAKHMLQCIKQYNGFNACTYCLHPGKLIENNNRKQIRYINTDVSTFEYTSRTHDITVTSMLKNNFDCNCDGVIGLSCLVSVPHFDIIKSFGIDYMHCILLGVVRKLLDFYLDSKNHKHIFYIKKKIERN